MAMRTGLINGLQPQTESIETKEHEIIEPMESKEDAFIRLYSEVVSTFASGLMFHTDASLKSHVIGLHGFKRLHRYNAFKDREMMLKYQHYVADNCREIIKVNWSELHIPFYDNVKDMFSVYLDYEVEKQEKLSKLYKEFINHDFILDAKMISEHLCELNKEIVKCKRYIQDFESSGWSWHHIRRVDMNLHDKYKKLEEEKYSYKD